MGGEETQHEKQQHCRCKRHDVLDRLPGAELVHDVDCAKKESKKRHSHCEKQSQVMTQRAGKYKSVRTVVVQARDGAGQEDVEQSHQVHLVGVVQGLVVLHA